MAANNSIEQIFKQNQYNLDDATKKSAQWYLQQIRDITRIGGTDMRPSRILRAEQSNDQHGLTAQLLPGTFHFFVYDPKFKDDPKVLPYYDTFPLCLPYRMWKRNGNTYFIGLNFHYLPPQARMQLLKNMQRFSTTKSFFLRRPTLKEKTMLNYNWQVIKGTSLHPVAKVCIKKYILSHVRSPFKIINPHDWATAMMLPAEQFKRLNKYGVWLQSASDLAANVRKHKQQKKPWWPW